MMLFSLLEYLDHIEQKTYAYLDSITDEMLYECPENCEHTRMELVLRQFRMKKIHIGFFLTSLITALFGEIL